MKRFRFTTLLEWNWRDLGNEISYRLRKNLPSLRKKPFSQLLKTQLRQEDIPESLASRLNEKSLRLSLFYLSILRRLPIHSVESEGVLLDLGSKDFAYAPGLAMFFAERYKKFSLVGLEVDTYQIYFDLFQRGDAGAYHARCTSEALGGLARIDYQQGDWLSWEPPQRYDWITCFFPFLYRDLHRGFGLPRSCFDPRAYYEKCFRWGRRVLFFHQGESEAKDSLELVQSLGLKSRLRFRESVKDNPWLSRKHPIEVLYFESDSAI